MNRKRLEPGTVVFFETKDLARVGIVLDASSIKDVIPTYLVVKTDQVLVRVCGAVIVDFRSKGSLLSNYVALDELGYDAQVIWQPTDGFQKLLDLVNLLARGQKEGLVAGLVSMDSGYLQAVVSRHLSSLVFLLSRRDPEVVQLQLRPEGYDKEILELFERGIPFPKKPEL